MDSRYLLVKMNRLFRLVFVWEPYSITIMFQAESSQLLIFVVLQYLEHEGGGREALFFCAQMKQLMIQPCKQKVPGFQQNHQIGFGETLVTLSSHCKRKLISPQLFSQGIQIISHITSNKSSSTEFIMNSNFLILVILALELRLNVFGLQKSVCGRAVHGVISRYGQHSD